MTLNVTQLTCGRCGATTHLASGHLDELHTWARLPAIAADFFLCPDCQKADIARETPGEER